MKIAAFLGAFVVCSTRVNAADSSWTIGRTVTTTSGIVNGHAATVAKGVSEYLGIPYAIPPVGNLRWTAPKALVSTQSINGSAVVRISVQSFSRIPTYVLDRVSLAQPILHNTHRAGHQI